MFSALVLAFNSMVSTVTVAITATVAFAGLLWADIQILWGGLYGMGSHIVGGLFSAGAFTITQASYFSHATLKTFGL